MQSRTVYMLRALTGCMLVTFVDGAGTGVTYVDAIDSHFPGYTRYMYFLTGPEACSYKCLSTTKLYLILVTGNISSHLQWKSRQFNCQVYQLLDRAMSHRSKTNIHISTVNWFRKYLSLHPSVMQLYLYPAIYPNIGCANPLKAQRHQSIGAQSTSPFFTQHYQLIAQLGTWRVTYIQDCPAPIFLYKWEYNINFWFQ